MSLIDVWGFSYQFFVNRCLGLSWLDQGSEIASRKRYLRFFAFLENVCRGLGWSPRGPLGHLSDENEALGPRNPFIRVPMPSFDKII